MRLFTTLAALSLATTLHAQLPRDVAQAPIEQVKPSATDPSLPKDYDEPHAIVRPSKMDGAPLAVFLPGTNGQPMFNGLLMRTVAGQGYRVIGLEYPDNPAVNQVCPKDPAPECAENFRAMRIWGEPAKSGPSPVKNSAADSINGRLISLLRYLDQKHPKEGWAGFLNEAGQPKWERIIVSGQSQGAGMAALIAKRFLVLRVICFSSPEDFIRVGDNRVRYAPWLMAPSATPPDRWWATRNSREPFNPGLTRTYPLLRIPVEHVKVFTLDLRPGQDGEKDPMLYHGAGIRDPRYIPDWQEMFGKVD